MDSNANKNFTGQLPHVTVASTAKSSCAVSFPFFHKCNEPLLSDKSHNLTSIIIPPPPGFKPPVISQCLHQLPQADKEEPSSVLSGALSNLRYIPKSSAPPNISDNDILATKSLVSKNSSLVYHSTYPGSFEINQQSTICTLSNVTIDPIFSALTSTTVAVVYTGCSNAADRGLCSPKQSYSHISQTNCPVVPKIADISASSENGSIKKYPFTNNFANNNFNGKSYSSTDIATADMNGNPFASPSHGSQSTNHSTNFTNVPLTRVTTNAQASINASKTKTDHASSNQIKTVRFANTNNFSPLLQRRLIEKRANMSLPNLMSKSTEYSSESSSEDSDVDLSASYSSLNPFSPNFKSSCHQTFEHFKRSKYDIENNEPCRKSHLSNSTNSSLNYLNSKFSKNHPLNNILPKRSTSCNTNINDNSDIQHDSTQCCISNNPFYQNQFESGHKYLNNGKTVSKLGDNFFACMLNTDPKESSTSNIDTKTVSVKVANINSFCRDRLKHEKNLPNNSLSFNTTNNFEFSPTSMTTLSSPTLTPKSIQPNIKSRTTNDLAHLHSENDSRKSSQNSSQNISAKSELGTLGDKETEDRYAALKDLDDVFKSTVLSEGKFIK